MNGDKWYQITSRGGFCSPCWGCWIVPVFLPFNWTKFWRVEESLIKYAFNVPWSKNKSYNLIEKSTKWIKIVSGWKIVFLVQLHNKRKSVWGGSILNRQNLEQVDTIWNHFSTTKFYLTFERVKAEFRFLFWSLVKLRIYESQGWLELFIQQSESGSVVSSGATNNNICSNRYVWHY